MKKKTEGRTWPRREAVAAFPRLGDGPSRAPRPAWERSTWLVVLPLALVVICAFLPALDNGFVSWDDGQNFLQNPYFRGLGTAQLTWAWTTFWLGAYHPLTWLLFETEYVFCKLDPRGYHLTSLALQVASTVVLYVLAMALLVRADIDRGPENSRTIALSAGLATGLFMVHPLRVETVAWATCQCYLPCALFSMLAVLAYLRAFGTTSAPRWGWLAGSFLLFVTALLFHPVAVGLPAVLLILDAYPLHRLWIERGRWFGPAVRKALWEKIPFAIASLAFMGLAIAAKPGSRLPVQHNHLFEGIARGCYNIWFYIIKTIWPRNLIAVYPLPKDVNWLSFPYNLSIVATLAMSAVLVLFRRRWPGLLAAWATYLVILAPNSGLIQTNDQIAADRYSFMSMLGIVPLLAAGFCQLWRMSWRWPAGAAVGAGILVIGLGALLVLTSRAREQCRIWLNSETLWAHVLTHGGGSSYVPHTNLGSVLSDMGKYKEAEALLLEALRLNPDCFDAHNNLGTIFSRQKRYAEAERHFAEALRINPGYVKAHYNLGLLNAEQGHYDAAAAHYSEALRLDPASADAHKDLGQVLNLQGKYDAAATHLTEALRLNPGYGNAHASLGTILVRERRYAEALSHFAEAIQLRPGDPNVYNESAMIMAACPDATLRDGKKAVEFATRACELTGWRHPEVLDTLAAAQAEAGEFEAAVSSQNKALALVTGQRQKADYRSRLVLYQAKRPYHDVSPHRAPTVPSP